MGSQLQGSSRKSGTASGRSSAYRPMSDINVTPFVDVMLVLLVVFMVTAPLLTSGVKVDFPESSAKAIATQDNKPLEVSLTKEGEIFIGETQVKEQRLAAMLGAMTKDDPERRIFIRADQGLEYGYVIKILGTLNDAGFSKVALLSTPAQK